MNRKKVALATIKERILLVDDEPEILGLLQLQLRKLGLKTDLACNGHEARKRLAQQSYGLVITDLEMPTMNGMALLAHIQENNPYLDVLVISGYSHRYSYSDIIAAGAADFISKPFKSAELTAKLQRIFNERTLLNDLARAKEKEKLFFLHIVESLAISLDEKDRYTHGHSRRVTNLALQLAQRLPPGEVDFDLLRLAGILHDIGKIGVPDHILTNPNSLTAEEFTIIKRHPSQGAHILQPFEDDARIAKISEIISSHHEHYNGKGYPLGLQGSQIPLLARIITIADSFDAMTSDRPYRQGLDVETALAEIVHQAGHQFDPDLATLFVSLIEECNGGLPCSFLYGCELFMSTADEEDDLAKIYKDQYCCANYEDCARYQFDKTLTVPANLLPDGNLR